MSDPEETTPDPEDEGVYLRVVLNFRHLEEDTAQEAEDLHTSADHEKLVEMIANLLVNAEVDVHDVQVWDA